MSPRTLWTIILKIFGLFLFLQVLYEIPQLFSTLTFLISDRSYGSSVLPEIASVFFAMSVYLFFVIAFIFKTDWLISALRLEKSLPDEKLELNMHRSTILQIAIIVSGLLLLIESLPMLLKGLFGYYQQMNDYDGFKKYPYAGLLILDLVKVLISFFMVTSSRLITNYVERRRKGKVKATGKY